ncbi:hypothetical protein WR25_17828 [Diploscapter pachys]|uniref:Tropomodulin n=1 Tax=Diploscapter pachys TaxID=2018661 RepID=A0A2A2KYZ7_9BILA|nr:hypothetical protein WR25_17828 [Diploscapter pachys]
MTFHSGMASEEKKAMMAAHASHVLGLDDDDMMSDEDLIRQIEALEGQEELQLGDLLKAMNENRIISWEEAERILMESDNTPVKSSLPEQTRPCEPDNDTDVDRCIQQLLNNDPSLKEVNLNNMKRTPVPSIRRLIEALAYNEHCERISLANMGLYDHDISVLMPVIEMNNALKKLNLETNYLSGEFFAKLFKAAIHNNSLEEVKAVNQISVNLRLPEGRHKIEKITLRNGDLRRIARREAALKAKQEAEEREKNHVEPPRILTQPSNLRVAGISNTAPPAKPKPQEQPKPATATAPQRELREMSPVKKPSPSFKPPPPQSKSPSPGVAPLVNPVLIKTPEPEPKPIEHKTFEPPSTRLSWSPKPKSPAPEAKPKEVKKTLQEKKEEIKPILNKFARFDKKMPDDKPKAEPKPFEVKKLKSQAAQQEKKKEKEEKEKEKPQEINNNNNRTMRREPSPKKEMHVGIGRLLVPEFKRHTEEIKHTPKVGKLTVPEFRRKEPIHLERAVPKKLDITDEVMSKPELNVVEIKPKEELMPKEEPKPKVEEKKTTLIEVPKKKEVNSNINRSKSPLSRREMNVGKLQTPEFKKKEENKSVPKVSKIVIPEFKRKSSIILEKSPSRKIENPDEIIQQKPKTVEEDKPMKPRRLVVPVSAKSIWEKRAAAPEPQLPTWMRDLQRTRKESERSNLLSPLPTPPRSKSPSPAVTRNASSTSISQQNDSKIGNGNTVAKNGSATTKFGKTTENERNIKSNASSTENLLQNGSKFDRIGRNGRNENIKKIEPPKPVIAEKPQEATKKDPLWFMHKSSVRMQIDGKSEEVIPETTTKRTISSTKQEELTGNEPEKKKKKKIIRRKRKAPELPRPKMPSCIRTPIGRHTDLEEPESPKEEPEEKREAPRIGSYLEREKEKEEKVEQQQPRVPLKFNRNTSYRVDDYLSNRK